VAVVAAVTFDIQPEKQVLYDETPWHTRIELTLFAFGAFVEWL